MRLLVVCASYAPENTPRAFRWTALVNEFRARGHVVDVVCRPNACQPDPPHVHRVPASRWIPAVSSGAVTVPPAAASGTIRERLRDVLRWTWRTVRWPDYDCLFIGPAAEMATRLLKSATYDSLITVSHPFSGHVVGLRLRQQFPELPWLADIGDPFATLEASPPNNPWLYRRKNWRAERAVLHQADAASLTTMAAMRSYQRDFSISGDKLRMIPPLYSLPESAATSTSAASVSVNSAKALRLVFLGRLYRQIRSPRALLALFAESLQFAGAAQWELHFYGNIDECADDFSTVAPLVGKSIFLHGEVPRAEADAARREADVLVNIGNSTPHQLPSKLVEYIASGKPVLNVVSHDHDTSQEILGRYPRTLTMNGNQQPRLSQAQQLAAFLTDPPPALDALTLNRLCARYSLPSIANEYLALIEQAIATHQVANQGFSRRRAA